MTVENLCPNLVKKIHRTLGDMIKKENPSTVILEMNGLTRIDVDGVDAIKNCQNKFKGIVYFEFVRDSDLSPDGFKQNNVNVNRQIQLTNWYPKNEKADKMGLKTSLNYNDDDY